MKYILVPIILLGINCHPQDTKFKSPVDPQSIVTDTEETPRATAPLEKWNFELVNRSKEKLHIIVKHNDQPITMAVLPAKTFSLKLFNAPKFRAVLPYLSNISLDIRTPSIGSRTYTFAPDKNIFITYENSIIRPQAGHTSLFKQGWQATESGIPLLNNITDGEITGNPEPQIERTLWDDVDVDDVYGEV